MPPVGKTANEDCAFQVRRLDHTDSAGVVVEALELRGEDREEGGGVVSLEERLGMCEELGFGG